MDKLCDLEVATRLLMAEVVRRGIDSRPGKTAWGSALRTILDAELSALRPPDTLAPPGALSPATREQLRALGYAD